jgi:hypothetical protein
MNDIWEDLISLAVIVLALAAYLILLNTMFANQMNQNGITEKYRRAQTTADLLATQWAYGPGNATAARLLDPAKMCTACPPNVSVVVNDIRKKQKICECGLGAAAAVYRLPAAVRYDQSDVAPAELKVTIQ